MILVLLGGGLGKGELVGGGRMGRGGLWRGGLARGGRWRSLGWSRKSVSMMEAFSIVGERVRSLQRCPLVGLRGYSIDIVFEDGGFSSCIKARCWSSILSLLGKD